MNNIIGVMKNIISMMKNIIGVMKNIIGMMKNIIGMMKLIIAMGRLKAERMKRRQKWTAFHQRGFYYSAYLALDAQGALLRAAWEGEER